MVVDQEKPTTGEPFYKCFCLACGADYTEDMEENLGECRKCGSPELEWEGFTV